VSKTRYSTHIDLSNLNTSQSLAILSVPPGSRVLDVGAADGSVARLLTERGCRVSAIEIDEGAAREASKFCEQVVIGDIEQLDLAQALNGRRFDAVLLLDVLEHLRDPVDVLTRSAALLDDGGKVIASIPNVAHAAVRLSLLRGTFQYTDTGLLDRTHLRFFDRQAVEDLFSAAKLDVRERLRVIRDLTETEIPIDPGVFPESLLRDLANDVDATTFQFVIIAERQHDRSAGDGAKSLAESLQERVRSLEARFQEVDAYARSLDADRQHHQRNTERLQEGHAAAVERLDDLKSELGRRMADIQQRELELRHLQSDSAVKEALASDLRQSLAAELSRAEAMTEAHGRASAELARTQVAFLEAQSAHEGVSGELAKVRPAYERALGELAKVQPEYERALGELAKVQPAYEQVLTELAHVRAGHERALGELDQTRAALSHAQSAYERVLAELVRTQAALSQVQSAHERASAELARTCRSQEHVSVELARTQATLSHVQSAFSETQSTLNGVLRSPGVRAARAVGGLLRKVPGLRKAVRRLVG
jgi:2-polyprenyl-3-methyl-5-hydroxy-6-metoxy-1,4-benzoquinol methylase